MRRREYKTKRLVLRALKIKDYSAWYDAYAGGLPPKSKWDVSPLVPKMCSRDWFRKIKKKHQKLAREDDYYRYYVFHKKTGAIVGLIDFDIFVRGSHQFANFGYRIFNRYWGEGYGQEAARAGLRIGFQQLKLNRLEAAINLDNKKSIRLAQSIGMRREGIKKRYWFENGKWKDHLIYVANPDDLKMAPPLQIGTK